MAYGSSRSYRQGQNTIESSTQVESDRCIRSIEIIRTTKYLSNFRKFQNVQKTVEGRLTTYMDTSSESWLDSMMPQTCSVISDYFEHCIVKHCLLTSPTSRPFYTFDPKAHRNKKTKGLISVILTQAVIIGYMSPQSAYLPGHRQHRLSSRENGKGEAKLIYTAVQPPKRTYLLLDRSIGSSNRQLQCVFAAIPRVTTPLGSHSRIRLLVEGTFTATRKQTT
ncbi:uncharacterized protein NECHADRAFT_89206 [Fusarium vanettenii 77-13-4]|uniref:Uncharacterized protein n=1 Tax=Fusarium vanettenii (strain ATCC MYA-4622 / CBS 123669 / FGSC 9596 / NRRL 45880 / 77-13-4) TaxID=660122 RepID=C7ZQI0_FUSV7|nr:uncharacterized protein NECHADRAFT_89206 [Fusarium vanettenii 77-13-4]EEU33722.1 predicted protein [Fusarium vanettenii 77-13-4]